MFRGNISDTKQQKAVATVFKSHWVLRRRKHSTHPLRRLLEYGHQYRKQIWLATTYSILNTFLILDEATSAVDNETEVAIQRSLERITVDKTTIA
ncbi:hypothetical protein A4S05_07280 [Nostoc sp. KVJ20]|nr:hypothetical protein A4S05_07280 [Nostoc sp. KVJ20]